MDLPKLSVLNDYWRSHPPTHLLVAAFMGFKPPSKAFTELSGEKTAEDIMLLFPQ